MRLEQLGRVHIHIFPALPHMIAIMLVDRAPGIGDSVYCVDERAVCVDGRAFCVVDRALCVVELF